MINLGFYSSGLCGNNNDVKEDDLEEMPPTEYVQKWKIGDESM